MSKLSEIRSNFPILQGKIYNKELVYLDNAATTQKPKCVIDSIVNFYTHFNSNIHRGVHYLSEKSSILYEQARECVAEFLHAPDVSEIIFTSGTTESINLVATSFGESFLNKGDEVVISEMEHHSNMIPWQRICEQKKCILRVIPIENDGSLSIDRINETLSAKTKIMAICHVSNVLGTINPIKEIINLAHAQGIPVLVDGAQAVQHLPVDLKDLDADFYAFSGHKVYAPTGIGVLYGKKKWLSKMPPYKSGGGMVSSVSIDKATHAKLPLCFEAGTPNYVGAHSLAKALDFINGVGIENILQHETDLFNYARNKLLEIDGLVIYGNASKMCGVITFNLESIHPYDGSIFLDKLGIAIRTGSHCAEPLMKRLGIDNAMRASFAMYNTHSEVDLLAEGLHKVKKLFGN